MRSVFSAGLLDGFLSKSFNPFDIYIGVSAGAFNLTTYLLQRPGLSFHIYSQIATNRRFISYSRFFLGGHLLDLDWLVQTVSSTSRLDMTAIQIPEKAFFACLTDVATGEAVYPRLKPDNIDSILKATMALPLVYREFPTLNGRPMTDGGVADGIPVSKAVNLGARKIMVVRSRHKDYVKKDTLWHRFIRWKLADRHELKQTLSERVERFDKAMSVIRQPPPGVIIHEICPPNEFHMGRFSRQHKQLVQGYNAGLNMSNRVMEDWLAN